jgi:hypothetical protein
MDWYKEKEEWDENEVPTALEERKLRVDEVLGELEGDYYDRYENWKSERARDWPPMPWLDPEDPDHNAKMRALNSVLEQLLSREQMENTELESRQLNRTKKGWKI